MRAFGAMRGVGDVSEFLFDLASRAKTRIHRAKLSQRLQGGVICGESIGLSERRAIPIEAKPTQILLDAVVKLRPDAGDINVFEAQQKLAALFASNVACDFARENVAEVQPASGAWGETRSNHREERLAKRRSKRTQKIVGAIHRSSRATSR
jgi:hypothetical protein